MHYALIRYTLDSMANSMLPPAVRHGLRMLRRDHSYCALLATLTGTLFLFHLLGLIALGVTGAEQSLTAFTDVRVTLAASASDDQIQNFLSALKKQPFAGETTYVTRDQAYEAQRKLDPSLTQLIERAQLGNPFRDTVAIRLTEGSSVDALESFLRNSEWSGVVDAASLSTVAAQEAHTSELLAGAKAVRFISMLLLFLALGVTVFALVMSFDARAELRTEEVTVSRLLGARPSEVLLPFITEATVLLLLASLLSACALGITITVLPLLFPALLVGSLADLWSTATSTLLLIFPFAALLHIVCAPIVAWFGVRMGVKLPALSLA